MSVDTETNIKAKLWNLETVEIRKVLRHLNNTVKKVIDPTILASAKRDLCHRTLLDKFNIDTIEQALMWLDNQDFGEEKLKPTDPVEREVQPTPDSKPVDPIVSALMGPIMASFDKKLSDYSRLYVDPHVATARKDFEKMVNSVVLDWGKKVTDRVMQVEDALMASQATNLTVLFPDADKVELGTVHKQQALLIQYLAAGCHVFLTGPAGSGKSTAGEKAAEALKLKFGSVSCCSQDTATKFMGYMDANGTYHTTEFREAYSNGGVFVIDEMDAGNPNVLAVLNSALSNSQCAFPDGMVKRHEKFRCIATGNTWGTGKTIQYVGRNAIDAATLNRFVVIYWDYDEALETKIAGMPVWSKYVQSCRAEIKRRGVNFLITPRASISGALALKAGIPLEKVIDNVLLPNLDPDIKRAMPPAPVIAEIR